MSKTSSIFVCQQCGYQSPSFLGKCPNCGEWNTLVEELKTQNAKLKTIAQNSKAPIKLSEIKAGETERISTGISELDLVLGGGLVGGMAVLLSGEPGIGKSTLLLQIADKLNSKLETRNSKQVQNSNDQNSKQVSSFEFRASNFVLYVAGEESASQIKIRAERLGIKTENLLILESTDVDGVVGILGDLSNLGLIIVDSIQTLTTTDLSGTAGSVGQVRECAARLISATKNLGVPLFLVGHVTKEGAIAGPKVLEHAVDTILNLEGEKFTSLRLLRTTKNRFGPTDEVGVFEMGDAGLKAADLSNLSNWSNLSNLPGSCLTITMEGTRPMLAEIQALVTSTLMPNPRRVASGVNYNRLQTIIAILQKRLNLPLYKEDIYVSVAGGLKIEEPAVDLAIALAIISSFKNKAVPEKSVAIGELDLLGNVRPVNSQERRVKEARKLGFNKIITSLSSSWSE